MVPKSGYRFSAKRSCSKKEVERDDGSKRSHRALLAPELLEKRSPQGAAFPCAGVVRRHRPHRGLDHDELRRRIDGDRLAVDAEEREGPSRARREPDLVAVAGEPRRPAG